MGFRSVRDRRLLIRHRRDSSFTAQFRADGPLGPGGVEIRNCGTSGAHATYCQDECGGYEGELPGAPFAGDWHISETASQWAW